MGVQLSPDGCKFSVVRGKVKRRRLMSWPDEGGKLERVELHVTGQLFECGAKELGNKLFDNFEIQSTAAVRPLERVTSYSERKGVTGITFGHRTSVSIPQCRICAHIILLDRRNKNENRNCCGTTSLETDYSIISRECFAFVSFR